MGAVSWAPIYQNGYIPDSAMTSYRGQGLLQTDAARSLNEWSDAFEAEFGQPMTISEGYRDYATQVKYYNAYKHGTGNVAAVPGTSSHGAAVAVDFYSGIYGNSSGTARHAWMRNTAASYNWSWDLVGRPSGEAWHWNYIGPTTTTAGSGGYTPIERTDDEEMLSDEAKAWLTTTIRDQTNAIVKSYSDSELVQIGDAITNSRKIEHQEIASRLDQIIAPVLRKTGTKPLLYRVTGTNGIWAVHVPLGYIRHVADLDDLAWLRNMGIVSTDKEQEITQSDLTRVLKEAEERLDELTGKSDN